MAVVGEGRRAGSSAGRVGIGARAADWVRTESPVGRERLLLIGAVLLGAVVQFAYVVKVRHYALAGDEPEYNIEGQLIAHGKLFYTYLPYGILHAGAWKAPLYPAWVGLVYAVFGHHITVVRLLQVPLTLTAIPLCWLLARRLFGSRVAVAAAFVVAVYPLVWQYEGLLYPESLCVPLYLVLFVLMLTRTPTVRRAVGFGLVLGIALLLRPTTEFILLGLLVAWCIAVGWRRGIVLTVVAIVVGVLVVAPWTIRNAVVMHGFVPISMQDSAAYGTFNAQSAHNREFPWAWEDAPAPDLDLFNRAHPLSDVTLRSRLIHRALSYISAHPMSVLDAFFWNGLSRLWDVRHTSRALVEVPYEGRSRLVTRIGLYMYYVLLPLCLIGLWRARRRPALLWGVLGIALGASIVFSTAAGTRYRAPLEPLIVTLACAGVLGAARPPSAQGLPRG